MASQHFNTMAAAELAKLAAHADLTARLDIADNRGTPVQTMLILAQDDSADLRYAIAENQNVHTKVLHILAGDDNPFVAHRAKTTLAHKREAYLVAFPAVETDHQVRIVI
jgi:hypothetical protein